MGAGLERIQPGENLRLGRTERRINRGPVYCRSGRVWGWNLGQQRAQHRLRHGHCRSRRETGGKEGQARRPENGLEMQRLSDREGNWCNRNCAQMSELRRKNEEATCTAAFERAILEAASICRSYSRDCARATRATERFLEEGIRTSFPAPSKTYRFCGDWELPLMRRKTAE